MERSGKKKKKVKIKKLKKVEESMIANNYDSFRGGEGRGIRVEEGTLGIRGLPRLVNNYQVG